MGISDINSQRQFKANECNLTLFLYTSLPYCAYILYITHTLSKQKHKTLNFTMNQSTRTVHGRRSRESMRAHYHHVHHYVFAPLLENRLLKGEFSERKPKPPSELEVKEYA